MSNEDEEKRNEKKKKKKKKKGRILSFWVGIRRKEMSTMQQQQQQQQLGDDGDLQGSVEAFFANTDSAVLMAFRVAKSQASWSVAGRRTRLTTKPRILVVTGMYAQLGYVYV